MKLMLFGMLEVYKCGYKFVTKISSSLKSTNMIRVWIIKVMILKGMETSTYYMWPSLICLWFSLYVCKSLFLCLYFYEACIAISVQYASRLYWLEPTVLRLVTPANLNRSYLLFHSFISVHLHHECSISNLMLHRLISQYIILTNSIEQSPCWQADLSQLIKKFPAPNGTQRLITIFTRALDWTLSWVNHIPLQHIYLE
jgi:hypothetical protein